MACYFFKKNKIGLKFLIAFLTRDLTEFFLKKILKTIIIKK